MVCRGICSYHKAIRLYPGLRYSIGQKRCNVCQIFINWQELWCPCCGYRLRTKPKNKKYKYNLLLSNNIIKK